jgi:hypothetical protein
MVQVFSPSPRAMQAGQIGQALGLGVGKNFVPPEQLVQRGLLQEGLTKISQLAQDPNTQPIDLLTQSMSAIAGIPGAERYAGPLIDKILGMSAYKRPLDDVQDGMGQQNGQGNPQTPQAATSNNQSGQAVAETMTQTANQEKVASPVSLESFIPMDIGSYINPDQAKSIVESVGKTGGDVNIVKQRIQEYNKGLIDYNTLVNSNVDRGYAQQQKQLKLESGARDFLQNQLDPNIAPDVQSVIYDMFKKELKNSDDFSTAYNKIQPNVQSLQRQLQEFPNKIPEGSEFANYGITEGQEKILRSASKNFLQQYPSGYSILEKMFTNRGQPITQSAKVLNPLSTSELKVMGDIEDYRSLIYPKMPMSERAMIRNLDMVQEEQTKSIPKIAQSLKKTWSDTTSLINIYTDMKVKGWFPQQIHELYDNLEKLGVKFSPQQTTERTQLAAPPPIPLRYL